MKAGTLFAFVLMAGQVCSQSFEGTIKWSIKSEITDPAIKAQMEQAQKQMNDPANQARMKEMQEKMNDPQFKKMMEDNPQLKAQMENMMKASQSGNMYSMMPSAMVVKIKGSNTLTTVEGGMANLEMLYLKDPGKTYQIDRQNQTYTVLPPPPPDPAGTKPVTITKTSETVKILSYTCTKYLAESHVNGQTVKQVFWATTEMKGLDLKNLTKQRSSNGQPLFYEGIEGIPLKMEMIVPQGFLIMEATEIKKESLKASDFVIPAGYKEIKSAMGNQ
jgi:hypothetical protein